MIKGFFQSIKNGLVEVFSDGAGRLSSMRIGFFWILFFETFNQTWATLHGVYTPMNLEAMGVLVSAFFAKSWQRKIESDTRECLPPKFKRGRQSGDDEIVDLPEYPAKH